jgi:hypothetical protein
LKYWSHKTLESNKSVRCINGRQRAFWLASSIYSSTIVMPSF